MSNTLAYLLYAPENVAEAQSLERDLRRALVQFIANPPVLALEAALKNNPGAPVICLVSDNFLRSIQAVEYAGLLDQATPSAWLSVLVDGQRDGQPVPTRIATIHEIMVYRDHWYDEWIRLRKQCNLAQGDALIALEYQKNIAKKMSTHISNFIKSLKEANMSDVQQFRADNYQLFFDKIGRGASSLHERFVLAEESNHRPAAEEQEQPTTVEVPAEQDLAVSVHNSNGHLEQDFTAVVERLHQNMSLEQEMGVEEERIYHEFELPTDLAFSPDGDDKQHAPPVVVEAFELPSDIILVADDNKQEHNPVSETENTVKDMDQDFSLRSLDDLDDVDDHAVLEQLVHQETDDIDVLFHLAQTETEESDFENALHYYEQVLKIDPFNGRALLGAARLLARHFQDRRAQADMLYRRAIAFNDESARLNYEYGVFLRTHFQEHRKAAELMRQALDLDPYLEQAYYELAFCQKELGQAESAKANYMQACALDPAQFQSPDNDVCFGILRAPSVTMDAVQQVPTAAVKNPNEDIVVLVTGATSGIGRAIAERFAVEGYRVIITGRREHRLYELRDYLTSRFEGIHLQPICLDVRDADALKNGLLQLPEAWQNVDILINNAGLAKGYAPLYEGSLEHWEQMIDTNLKGLLYMTRTIAPTMVKRQKGHIINIGSLAAKEVYPNGNVYCATKAAVDTLTRSLRLELCKHNVRVSVVNPGMVEETEFSLVRYDDDLEKANIYQDFNPLRTKDIADMVFYMASRPEYVDIQDVVMSSTQQGGTNFVHRNGRKF